MPYWQLFYHIVWATKNREPWLDPDVEPIVHEFLRTKAIGLEATVFALNGTPDHVHMVAAIPPKLAVAKFIGQVKAVASTKFNKLGRDGAPLFWQEEYGAFSFDGKRLPNYIAYVERQKEHHAAHTTIPILERTEGHGVNVIREPAMPYMLEEDEWRRELEEGSPDDDLWPEPFKPDSSGAVL
jgi:REP element-mobilizing transposase RayT